MLHFFSAAFSHALFLFVCHFLFSMIVVISNVYLVSLELLVIEDLVLEDWYLGQVRQSLVKFLHFLHYWLILLIIQFSILSLPLKVLHKGKFSVGHFVREQECFQFEISVLLQVIQIGFEFKFSVEDLVQLSLIWHDPIY